LDVVCDWNAIIAFVTSGGAIVQPIRHPVIAYAFATPLISTRLSREAITSSADVAGRS
jgi:hypothetical protein